ncbi:MAG: TlpA disulfide reductase family protein [Cytophagales bacterium]|nr:TlpA disulfide reductase family protein [Cytophagales bacterium]
MKQFFYLASLSLVLSCSAPPAELKSGIWRGVVLIQGKELPFNFRVERAAAGNYTTRLYNGDERLILDEITINGDSVTMVLHSFDAAFKAVIRGDSLVGEFVINYADGYRLPFLARAGQSYRFVKSDTTASAPDFSGTYDVDFFNEKNTVRAMGVIGQKGNRATGTFLTPTGDYRYLEGNVVRDTLWLSTFDGNHLYLFNAVKTGQGTLQGTQWLGRSRNRRWEGIRNDQAKPPASETLTFLKPGYDRLDFAFPNIDGDTVRSSDVRFKNKVVIVQILGSWCPNCMDETKFLVEWYNRNKDRGVEIIGLAYEQKADFDYASGRVKKMIDKLAIPYEVLIAGVNDNKKASETLPALNQVIGFPTTIFIGKDGKVKAIHTGFTGPGTGIYFEQMKERFNQDMNGWLAN